MPNPYHDADGKFCSRGEMQEAIRDAQNAQNLGIYLRLREDLAKADAQTEYKNTGFVRTAGPSGTVIPDEDWKEITDFLKNSGSTPFEQRVMLAKYKEDIDYGGTHQKAYAKAVEDAYYQDPDDDYL